MHKLPESFYRYLQSIARQKWNRGVNNDKVRAAVSNYDDKKIDEAMSHRQRWLEHE